MTQEKVQNAIRKGWQQPDDYFDRAYFKEEIAANAVMELLREEMMAYPGQLNSQLFLAIQREKELRASLKEILQALRVLVDHAQEQYPHFESERGQRDIQLALEAIAKAENQHEA